MKFLVVLFLLATTILGQKKRSHEIPKLTPMSSLKYMNENRHKACYASGNVGICMFQSECKLAGMVLLGLCKDGLSYGACCHSKLYV